MVFVARRTRAHPPRRWRGAAEVPNNSTSHAMRSSAGYSAVGRPSDASRFPVRSHGGPSLARPARAVVLSLLSVLVQPRCLCPSGEAIADDHVHWVVRVGLLLLHEQELEILFCNLSSKTGRAWSILVVVQGSEGSTAFFVLFVPITILESTRAEPPRSWSSTKFAGNSGGTRRSTSKRLNSSQHVVVVTVASS